MGNTFNTGRLINGLFVDASGNVGIGTTTPAEKLSVIGNIRIDNGAADGGQLVLASSGFSDWNLDNFSGRFRAYYGATERFTITTSGNVGIGTSSPNYSAANRTVLDINGTNESLLSFSNGGTQRGYIYSTTSGQIFWAEGSRNMEFGIAGAGYMGFGTNNTERMRITSAGNVGIGTTNPLFKLDVIGGIRVNEDGAGTKVIQIRSDFAGVDPAINVSTNNALLLQTNNTERMRITSGGNVGIGTSSPSEPLSVSFAAHGLISQHRQSNGVGVGQNFFMKFNDASGSAVNYAGIYADIQVNTTGAHSGRMILQVANAGSLLSAITIANNGNVGIGTSSPERKLHVTNSIMLSSAGAAQEFLIGDSNVRYFSIQTPLGAANLQFNVYGGSNIMTLTSGGALSLNGRFVHQGVSRLCYAGTVAGNGSFSVNLVVGSQSAVKITAAMNHYGYIDGYGCAKMAWVGSNPAFSQIVISEVTSGNGGSWSFTNGGSGIITITKNAGSYGGGGYYFIEVVGNDPQSIS